MLMFLEAIDVMHFILAKSPVFLVSNPALTLVIILWDGTVWSGKHDRRHGVGRSNQIKSSFI